MLDAQWPEAIRRAYLDTWFDDTDYLGREKEVDYFAVRWGDFTPDTFVRVLRYGNQTEQLFSIFALGHLSHPDIKQLLTPFLSSSDRKHRWASIIVLGRQKHALVFDLLQDLLLEEIECSPNYDQMPVPLIENLPEDHDELLDDVDAWRPEVDPDIEEIHRKQRADMDQCEWYAYHRLAIPLLLGSWGDTRALPTLKHTVQQCWERDHRLGCSNIAGWHFETWHKFEDRLAYGLGQLRGWDALDELDDFGLPAHYFHFARLYLILGSLQLQESSLFYLRESSVFSVLFFSTVLRHRNNYMIPLSLRGFTKKKYCDPGQIATILVERYGFTNDEQCEAYFYQLGEWYQERYTTTSPF